MLLSQLLLQLMLLSQLPPQPMLLSQLLSPPMLLSQLPSFWYVFCCLWHTQQQNCCCVWRAVHVPAVKQQVPRQRLIQVDLLDKLPLGTADLQVPAEGMTVRHIRCARQLLLCTRACKWCLFGHAS
jgi:hypothetical protein